MVPQRVATTIGEPAEAAATQARTGAGRFMTGRDQDASSMKVPLQQRLPASRSEVAARVPPTRRPLTVHCLLTRGRLLKNIPRSLPRGTQGVPAWPLPMRGQYEAAEAI